MATFRHVSELDVLPIWTGVVARRIEGREMTFALVHLDPNASVGEHRHPNEQMGIILAGSLRFTIGGEVRDLRQGDTYVIPANVPHDAVAGAEGTVVIDVFSPTRADWSRFTPQPPSVPPTWP